MVNGKEATGVTGTVPVEITMFHIIVDIKNTEKGAVTNEFFYADCIDAPLNSLNGEPVWEYTCTFKDDSPVVTYQQKSWEEIKKKNTVCFL